MTPTVGQIKRKGKTMGARRITQGTNLSVFVLEAAQEAHPHWDVSRVAETYLLDVEAWLKTKIHESLRKHPPQGKTVRDLH
jgi:hypothetical protein